LRPFEASTTIEASPQQVWAVLADSAGWSRWNSGVDGVDGVLAPGKRVTIRSSVAPGRAFPVKVTRFEPSACLELTGGLPLGLFRGVRSYLLSGEDSTTEFTMREVYSGPLTGLIGKSIPDLQPSFEQFVSGLKERVERGR
jgi:uncharacterized protein YndB with AHSA1/START domain